MGLKSFEDLQAYQSCKELRIWIKALVRTWPRDERFDLIDQIRRSSRSACANLAEGFGRNNSKDNARFCRITIGSLQETLNHLIDAHESEYIDDNTLLEGRLKVEKGLKITRGYMRYLCGNSELREPEIEYGDNIRFDPETISTSSNEQPTTNNK